MYSQAVRILIIYNVRQHTNPKELTLDHKRVKKKKKPAEEMLRVLMISFKIIGCFDFSKHLQITKRKFKKHLYIYSKSSSS